MIEKTITTYVAGDGIVFQTRESCELYEKIMNTPFKELKEIQLYNCRMKRLFWSEYQEARIIYVSNTAYAKMLYEWIMYVERRTEHDMKRLYETDFLPWQDLDHCEGGMYKFIMESSQWRL